MTDEELEELLRRTLRNRAASIRPSNQTSELPELPLSAETARRRFRPNHYVISGLAAAAAIALVLGIVLSTHHAKTNLTVDSNATTTPAPTVKNVGIGGTATTLPPPTTTIPPTTTTTIPPLQESTVPAGFSPASTTFVSAHTGWALGSAPCGSSRCATLVRTTDGGATWYEVPAPSASVPTATGTSSGTLVRFANLDDGWIVVPMSGTAAGGSDSQIWSTHDGGRDWAEVVDPAGSTAGVEDIEASNGVAYLLALADTSFRVYSSPASEDNFGPASSTVPFGAGPVPSATLTLQGSGGWVVEVDRTTIAGAQLSGGGWTAWTPPCREANGAGVIAASSSQDLIALCTEGTWGTVGNDGSTPPYPSEWMYQSTNGGASFTALGAVPNTALPNGVTPVSAAQPTATPGTVVIATDQGLVETFDGGTTWQTEEQGQSFDFVGFTTAVQGVAVSSSGGLYMTYDGGHTWSAISF